MTSLLQCPDTVAPGTTVFVTDVPEFAGAQPTGAGYVVDANHCITVEDEEHAARLVRDLGYVARADAPPQPKGRK